MNFPKGLSEWFIHGNRGISSNAMVEVFERLDEGMLLGRMKRDHPHDPSDFNRCVELLDMVPEYKTRLEELRSISKVWNSLVDHWDELVSILEEDKHSGRSDCLYERIQEIIKNAGGSF